MTVVATALRELLDLGVTGEALVSAIERIEAAAYPATQQTVPEVVERTRAAERTRRWRARHKASQEPSQTVTERHETSHGVTDGSPPSPKPPSTSPVIPTPFTPLKGGVSPAPSTPPLAEQIWALQPLKNGKRRATRPDVDTALKAALKRGKAEDILAACQAYYRLPDSTKDGGEYAMGAARLLAADRWREFLPTPEPPPAAVDGPALAARLRHYRDTGEWKAHWGERPRNAA